MREPKRRSSWRAFAIAAVAAVMVLAACAPTSSSPPTGSAATSGSGSGGGELRIPESGGSYGRGRLAAYYAPFEQETGIDIKLTPVPSANLIPLLQAQQKSGNVQWDLVGTPPANVAALPDLFMPIDYSKVHKDDVLYPAVASERYVSTDIETFPIIGYSTKAFPKGGPQTWADFWDTTKFPGRRSVPNTGLNAAIGMVTAALIADGVAPGKLLPIDLDRAFEKLDQLKPSISVYYTSYTQSQDILRSGEVQMVAIADGRCLQLFYADEPVECSFKGGYRSGSGLAIPKGAKNVANALKFLDYLLTHPQQQAVFTSMTFYGPPTKAGVAAADKLEISDYSSKHVEDLVPGDSDEMLNYMQQHSDELLKRYNAWLAK